MIQFILRLMSNKNSHLLAIHNEFLNIHLYIRICHCRVCICCLYCLAGYNCILWTKIDKWLSHLLYSTLLNNCTVGYFLINIFCVGIHFFIIHVYKSQAGTVGAYLKTFKYVHMLIRIGTLIRKCRVGGFSCLLNHVSQLKLTK